MDVFWKQQASCGRFLEIAEIHLRGVWTNFGNIEKRVDVFGNV
jgi:hypothetical protein